MGNLLGTSYRNHKKTHSGGQEKTVVKAGSENHKHESKKAPAFDGGSLQDSGLLR
jgi:hypothetical protein